MSTANLFSEHSLQRETEPSSVLEELGGILVDCLRLQGANIETTGQVIDAICTHVLETGLSDGFGRLPKRSLQPWQETRATELLLSASSSRPSISDIAKACGMSTAQFSRAFKARFGQTAQQWRLGAQIERAQLMMFKTNISLTEIAVECGFAEQSHFNHTFRKWVGCCPSIWRKHHANSVSERDTLDGTLA